MDVDNEEALVDWNDEFDIDQFRLESRDATVPFFTLSTEPNSGWSEHPVLFLFLEIASLSYRVFFLILESDTFSSIGKKPETLLCLPSLNISLESLIKKFEKISALHWSSLKVTRLLIFA
jgi:hypothetical protein